MSASQKRSSSSLSSDSVGSIIRHPDTGNDIVGAWKPAHSHVRQQITITNLSSTKQLTGRKCTT